MQLLNQPTCHVCLMCHMNDCIVSIINQLKVKTLVQMYYCFIFVTFYSMF
ncbi:hypothetical protein Hanom_Chr09g00819381 [Helianthus anomalus]